MKSSWLFSFENVTMESKDLTKKVNHMDDVYESYSMSLLHECFTKQAYNRHFIDDLENT